METRSFFDVHAPCSSAPKRLAPLRLRRPHKANIFGLCGVPFSEVESKKSETFWFGIFQKSRTLSGVFRTVSERFGPFQSVSDRFRVFRTVSECFGPFQSVSDRLRKVRDLSLFELIFTQRPPAGADCRPGSASPGWRSHVTFIGDRSATFACGVGRKLLLR